MKEPVFGADKVFRMDTNGTFYSKLHPEPYIGTLDKIPAPGWPHDKLFQIYMSTNVANSMF